MKSTLPLLTALLLTPLGALHAAPSSNAHIVIASEAGAKLDSDVTKGGGTDDTALIQSILDRAPKLSSLKLIVEGPILVTGLKVHSNTIIECLNRACGFYLADNSNHPRIASSTPQPEGRINHNLSFLGGTYNCNGVEQVFFRDVSITNSRTLPYISESGGASSSRTSFTLTSSTSRTASIRTAPTCRNHLHLPNEPTA